VRDAVQHEILSVHDLNWCTPRLRADNYLHSLTAETDDTVDVKTTAEQFM
jgi:hypothetical protein